MLNFLLINNNSILNEKLEELKKADYISIDTESDGLYSYEDKLCLVQLETNGRIYIIDPLSVDMDYLKEIFENKNIEKIFHSATSDISMIKKNTDCAFSNIFDTMIASKYIYKKAVSLSNIVKNYFKVELNKKCQKVNWGKRPLRIELLEYAAMDVYYLKKIRDIFREELIKMELLEEFKYTCEKISKTAKRMNNFYIEKYVSMAHSYNLEEMEFYIFLDIVKKREEIAKKINIPPFKIITNELLVYISKHYDELLNAADIKLYNRSIIRNIDWIRRSINSVLKGERNYFNYNSSNNSIDYEYQDKFKNLKKWRRLVSEKTQIPCELIIETQILKRIAKHQSLDIEKLKELGVDEKRIEKYGSDLINFFNSLQKKE